MWIALYWRAMQFGLFGQPVIGPRRHNKRNLTLDVAVLALHVGRLTLQDYSKPKSPHRYTQPQLLAVLILKAYLKATYRGVVELLSLSADLRDVLGLTRVPEHSSLKRFADRLSPAVLDQAVAQVLSYWQDLQDDNSPATTPATELALGSTGVECTPASRHYEMRIGRTRGRYVKPSLAVTCTTLLLVTFVASFGPSHDRKEVAGPLWRSSGRCTPAALYADAGYDLEATHACCRDGWGVRSYIPPIDRGGHGVVRSPHRATMTGRDLTASGYGRRWHVESFISGFKRSTAGSVRARTDAAMLTEAGLNLLAYAIRRA